MYDSNITFKNRKYWINTRLSPIKDKKGEVVAVIGVSRDITERKQSEKELEVQKQYMEDLFESSPLAIVILDNNDRILHINREFSRLFGYLKEEAMCKEINDLIVPVKLKQEGLSLTRQVHVGKKIKIESIRKSKTGRKFSVQIIGVPIKLNENQLGVYGIYQDITEQKQAEDALRESEEKYRKLFNTSPEGIVITSLDSRILDANKGIADMLGYTVEELKGKNFQEFTPEKWYEIEAEAIRSFLENGFGSLEKEYIRKDGTIFPISLSGWLIKDKEGNPEKIGAFIRDITERKQMEVALKKSEEQLRQIQKLEGIGQLAGGIAHDINNILTAMIGNTELALMGLEKGENIRNNLEQVMSSGRNGGELVAKILAFSHRQVIYPEVINVNSTILNLAKTLPRMISEDIKIKMILCDNISPVKADTTQIEQILINLAVNARDAIKQKKKQKTEKVITIETAEVFLEREYVSSHVGSIIGQHILISVTDNGIGMDKEIINRIFEPFFTTKELGKGTGLGLSIVYGIVKQNQASIYVYSEPGRGTTVKIYWPAFMGKTQPKHKVKGKKIKGGSETILFVEDDDKIRKASEQLLVLYGYKVFSALNGRLALDLVKTKKIKIDMLVTDVVMPEMGGIELSEKLKEIYPGLKMIYCSGYPDHHIISANGILKEDVDFISKPYSSKELAKKIREILDKK